MTSDHLSDELLSAHLDGAGAGDGEGPADNAAVEAHLSTCPRCTARRAALGAVSELVRTPPAPVSAQRKAAAIAAVVARGRLEDASPSAYPAEGAPTAPAYRLAWYRRPSTLAGAAAAAVVVAALAVPLALGTQPAAKSSAAKDRHSSLSAPSAPPHRSATAQAPATVPPGLSTAVPDLGSVDSTAQLRSDVAGVVNAGSAGAKTPSASASVTPTTPSTPSNGANPSTPSPPPAKTSTVASSACVQSTRTAAQGGAYGPAVVATATYRGNAAVIMEFWPTPTAPVPNAASGARGIIAVVSQSGCALLATTPS